VLVLCVRICVCCVCMTCTYSGVDMHPSCFVWGVSLSRATSMFDKHLFMASNESATSSALLSHSNSSGRADRKIRPTSLSCSLNCDGFFFAPILEHVRHCANERRNCSVVQSQLHVGHCLFIAVANALHHHPLL